MLNPLGLERGFSLMAKKEKRELTPEEKAEKLEKKLKKRKLFGDTFFKALAVILTLALIFSVAYIAFSRPVILTETKYVAGTTGGTVAPSTGGNTTPANTTPSNGGSTTPSDNGGSSTPADNGGSSTPSETKSAAQIINEAMAAAEGAGYTWSRTGNISNLKVPFQNMLKGVLESKNTTLEAVVGGFLGAKGNTETVTRGKGETPKNEEGTDDYYHWAQYKIIKTSVTDDDLKGLQVNGNQYSFTLDAVVNPEAGNSGFSRFTNDFVTLDMINTELAGQGVNIKVDAMTATY